MSEKTIAYSIAHEILTTSVKIPTLPANGQKILTVVRQSKDEIDIPGFAKLVESDPGLFTRILQVANSPFYRETKKINSMKAAITRIGLTETVNSVCLHFFQKMLPKFPDIEGFVYQDFWAHSWVCALANRRLGHPNLDMGALPGDLYMAGLLHGMGKLFMAIHFPEKFGQCIRRAKEWEMPLHQAEREIFGTTDAFVASKVLHAWDLPANVCEGVAFHQMPDQAPPEHIIMAGLTQFAYAMAGNIGSGASGDGARMKLSETFFGSKPNLKIAKKQMQEIIVREVMEALEGKKKDDDNTPARENYRRKFVKSVYYKQVPQRKEKPEKKNFIGWIKSLWQ